MVVLRFPRVHVVLRDYNESPSNRQGGRGGKSEAGLHSRRCTRVEMARLKDRWNCTLIYIRTRGPF
jgi:hypothetical protein